MADVEMQDAAADAAAAKTKSVVPASKQGAADATDSKKKFEVKKVGYHDCQNH